MGFVQISPSTAAAAVCVLAAGALLLYRALLPKPIPGIPYNRESANRLLGDAPDLLKWQADTKEIWSYIRKLANDLQSPVIQVFMRPLGKPWVIVTDFRESQDIQLSRKDEFDRSRMTGEVFGPIFPENHVSFPTNEKWRAHRQLIRDTISPSFLNGVVAPAIHSKMETMIRLWQKRAALAHGRPFHVDKDISRTVVDTMILTTFGFEVGSLKSQEEVTTKVDLPTDYETPVEFPEAKDAQAFTAIRDLSDSVQLAMGSPIPGIVLPFALTFFPSLISARKFTDSMIKSRLQAAWKKFSGNADDDDQVKSGTDLIIQRAVQQAKKEGREVKYDAQVIRDELFGFYMAGQETTSVTLGWAVKYLTANQDVQKNLRAALRQTYTRAAATSDIPTAQEVTRADVPYLDAFINEVHRMGNSVNSIVRVSTKDTVILGHHVPKGTDVFMLTNGPSYKSPALDIDESIRSKSSRETKDRFGAWDDQDISKFNPDRWLTKDEAGNVKFNPDAGPVHPYGAGPRACFGIKWAALMLRMVVTLIVWKFELQEIPDGLAGFEAMDITTHRAQNTILKLAEVY